MKVIGSSSFLKEFTLCANNAADEGEIYIVQRANGKNSVLMSMEKYNELNKKIYALQQGASD